MSPWQLTDDRQLSPVGLRARIAFAVVLFVAALISLFISSIPWQLLLIYSSLGLVVGLLFALDDQLPGILGMAILTLGLQPEWLDRFAPRSYTTWWQPGLVTLAVAAAIYLVPKVLRPIR